MPISYFIICLEALPGANIHITYHVPFFGVFIYIFFMRVHCCQKKKVFYALSGVTSQKANGPDCHCSKETERGEIFLGAQQVCWRYNWGIAMCNVINDDKDDGEDIFKDYEHYDHNGSLGKVGSIQYWMRVAVVCLSVSLAVEAVVGGDTRGRDRLWGSVQYLGFHSFTEPGFSRHSFVDHPDGADVHWWTARRLPGSGFEPWSLDLRVGTFANKLGIHGLVMGVWKQNQ